MSGLFQSMSRWAQHVPSQCAVCHAWPAQRICQACVARFAQPVCRCTRCALEVPPGIEVCGACLRNPPVLDACVAAVPYAYPWTQAIKAFKFQGDPGWAGTLARVLLGTPWAKMALDRADEVLCVPLSEQRLRERGFNQAALLARALSPAKANAHALIRLHDAAAQSSLNRTQRLRNLRNTFMVEPRFASQLQGQRVVLVDDVMTTGATLDAVATTLRASGAAHITAMVVARTERA